MPKDPPGNRGGPDVEVGSSVRVSGMQAKLHRWAVADPGRRFDDLFNFVHDPATPNASYRDAIQYVEHELGAVLQAQSPVTPPEPGRLSRRLRHFPLSPEIRMFPDDKGTHYILEVVAGAADQDWPQPEPAEAEAHVGGHATATDLEVVDEEGDRQLVQLLDDEGVLELPTEVHEVIGGDGPGDQQRAGRLRHVGQD